MKISGANLIVNYLRQQTQYAFLVSGKLIDPIVQAIAHCGDLKGISTTSELGSGYMADGYARASGNLGVCLSTGGPGASNLITAAINARLEASKVLFVTGDVATNDQGLGSFHDSSGAGTRSVEIFQQALGYSRAISDSGNLLQELDRALMNTPAHLTIPLDIQTHDYESITLDQNQGEKTKHSSWEKEDLISDRFYEILNNCSKIILLVGSRVIKNGLANELLDFAETYQIPVATTLSAKGAIPETHPLSLGVFGYGGNQRANKTLMQDNIEALLLVGLDFSQNESLEWNSRLYTGQRRVIRIDQQPRQFSLMIKVDLELIGLECPQVLKKLSQESQNQLKKLCQTIPERLYWLDELQKIPWHCSISPEDCLFDRSIPLDRLIQALQQKLPPDSILCVDAGSTRRFAGYSWISSHPHSFFSSSKLAPMGWAIAAGIGIQLAFPNQRVIVLTGDGSMMMHGLEIITAVRYQLPVLFVICNNRGYGDVYQRFKNNKEMNAFTLLPAINWVQFAQSLGVAAVQVKSLSELEPAVERILASRHPFVLEVLTPLTYLIN